MSRGRVGEWEVEVNEVNEVNEGGVFLIDCERTGPFRIAKKESAKKDPRGLCF